MSQNVGSLPPLSQSVTHRKPPPPLTCDVIYGWPLTSGSERKITSIAAFLHISKADDSTWHIELVYQIVSMNFSGELIREIRVDPFVAQIFFRVKMEGAFPGWRLIKTC